MADIQRDDLQAIVTPEPSSPEPSSPELSSPEEPGAPEAQLSESGSSAPAPAAPAPAGTAEGEPSLEASTTVPPLGGSVPGGAGPAAASDGVGEGGEWALLVEKLQAWWGSGQLQTLWQQSRTPLTLGLTLVVVLLVLQVYAGLLGAINSLPLVPGLLELVGLIWAVRYGLPQLIRRSERERLLNGLQQRWSSFRGKG
jgi:hypothetical protein